MKHEALTSLQLADDDEHGVELLAGDLLHLLVVREPGDLRLVVEVAEQRAFGSVLPEDGHRVAALHQLSLVGLAEALRVVDPVVPEALRAVVLLVLQHLNQREIEPMLERGGQPGSVRRGPSLR